MQEENKTSIEENKTSIDDWRNEITESKPTFKLQDGETETVVFLNEGNQTSHPDFGESIVFELEHNKENKRFFVNPRNFALLKQLKEVGTLIGKAVEISRSGSSKSDTRYTIKQLD